MRREILENATSLAKAGFIVFKLKGKIPAVSWRKHPYTLSTDISDYFGNWGHNYGVAPAKDQLIIDIDPRNFNKHDKPHKRLWEAVGIDLKNNDTPIVKTGGGGFHVYFRIKNLPKGKKIRKHLDFYKGIDFISDGAYVVGPGSIHPDTGKEYILQRGFDSVMDAPQDLIDLLTTTITPKVTDDVKSLKDDDSTVISRYETYLKAASPADEGDSGDLKTYKVACVGRDFALSPGKTLDMMLEHYNPRCNPPWDSAALYIKVQNAFAYANGGRGSNLAENDFDKIDNKSFENTRWDMSGNNYKSNLNNTLNQFLPLERFGLEDNALHHCVALNGFSNKLSKIKWMPWDHPNGKKMPKNGVEWSDDDSVGLRAFLSVKRKLDPNRQVVDDAVRGTACKKYVHPVRDYLNNLVWDQKSRLETWLIDNSGAQDNILNRQISKIMIMQAVARINVPGCQCDYVPILEGDQGIRKTTLVKVLGGEWYADINIDPSNKDTADAMRGKWFIEMSEMEATRKAEANALKGFITRATDRYRPAYAASTKDVPRQCVFIGTFNPDALGQYLNDTTGNRRFLPISLGGDMINTDAILKIRDQLFAEASERYSLGEQWFITDPKALIKLQAEQRKRQMSDGWMSLIEDYVENYTGKYIEGITVFTDAVHGVPTQYRFHEQRRVANCLREIGCEKTIYRNHTGKPVGVFLNPNFNPNTTEERLYDN